MFQEIAAAARSPDLADHFVECHMLGRHLTMLDDDRYVISDDFWAGRLVDPVVASVASICARDILVARAAIIPLSQAAGKLTAKNRRKYEELFDLIEKRAFSKEVRTSAHAMLEDGFREARIRELEADLGGRLTPARKRYRMFLDVVRRLTEGEITRGAFLDEFMEFTRAVAGKLDFGIYSLCLDRIFINQMIPLDIKQSLVVEVLKYPPLIRKELITNLMSTSGRDPELVRFTTRSAVTELDDTALTDIYLLAKHKVTVRSMARAI
ncbi:MAG: hypothetical protein A3G18_09065 [Rhodospirillales bacterium RIFCSPLOWO2_12_FULL_58_28]|nr:MAG: hypothetical protein A3H92_10805 [Rhodospirillales bacterium RIFCSPLOWO2_02_FULL_58_16]OHC79210.1 MAG: hypothetical protein A3G18_09065 [Rhodospirillales bacterium RIFCSPLOWO2_12_FULL_58_28]